MAITNANYWPLGSTVQKIIPNPNPNIPPLYSTHYEHFGLISVNPVNGHMVIFYRRGTKHVGTYGANGVNDPGEIYIRHSIDGGANWDTETLVKGESGIDIRNYAGGYDSNGRLFIFYGRFNSTTTPLWHSMNYIFSDNDGISWSSPVQLLTNSNATFSPYGHIIDAGNGILFQTWYGNYISGTNTIYTLNLYKSTDGGLTFPYTINICPTGYTNIVGEQSMVNLGGGCFLALARTESAINQFRQFKSEDGGNTWTPQDTINGYSHDTTVFEISSGTLGAPPFLSYINYEGVGIVACYYTIREPVYSIYGTTNPILKVVFALAKNLLDNGPITWGNAYSSNNLPVNNIIKLFPIGTSKASGYQSFFHPLNQYKGIGLSFIETVSNSNAYPEIYFTNDIGQSSSYLDMISVIRALGL